MTDKDRAGLSQVYNNSLTPEEKAQPYLPWLEGYTVWLEEQLHTVRSAMSQVDDELIVNWIAPPKDGNYRKALSQLVCSGIEEAKFFENESKRTDAVCDSDFPFPT